MRPTAPNAIGDLAGQGLGSLWNMTREFRLAAAAISAVGLLALLGCGGDDGADGPAALPSGDDRPAHIHGLGIDPGDGALLIATHGGLYRVPEGEQIAERVGESHQDTMGFTVVGPDHFLGSGHPDAAGFQAGDPPLLGLIESRDGGNSWRPISLRGQADFHVLRFFHNRVYGYDASNNRFLVSADGGATWEQRRPPAPMLDVAVNPANPQGLIASGEDGLFRSTDGGGAWEGLGGAPGFLAWPTTRALFLVDASGHVQLSRDGGGRFESVGDLHAKPAAFLATSERELYVALHDGSVRASVDGGRTWRLRSAG
jgi:hypothetical protein